MGAADRQGNFIFKEKMRQGLGHGKIRQAKAGEFNRLGVYGPDHIADNHQIRRRLEVFRMETLLHGNVLTSEEIRHGRIDVLIRAGDMETALFEHTGQCRHGCAADADQVDVLRVGGCPVQGRIKAGTVHLGRTVRSMVW